MLPSSHSGNVPSTKPDNENMMARKKYDVFKIRVQLLKVTNFSIPRGCTSSSSLVEYMITNICPDFILNMYTIALTHTPKQMIRQNNTKEDGSQVLENEPEDSKSKEGRSRKKKRNELKNAITPRVVRLCTVASFGPY
tara:strand:+ start:3433 stop:3846 length:414 start_codon:yes stop_codon:yes gene_type:complete